MNVNLWSRKNLVNSKQLDRHWILEFIKQVLPKFDSPTTPFFAESDLVYASEIWETSPSYYALQEGKWNLLSFSKHCSSQYFTTLHLQIHCSMLRLLHHSHLPKTTRSYFLYLYANVSVGAISTKITSFMNNLFSSVITDPIKGSKDFSPGQSTPVFISTSSASGSIVLSSDLRISYILLRLPRTSSSLVTVHIRS